MPGGERHIVEAIGKFTPGFFADLARLELIECLARKLAEIRRT